MVATLLTNEVLFSPEVLGSRYDDLCRGRSSEGEAVQAGVIAKLEGRDLALRSWGCKGDATLLWARGRGKGSGERESRSVCRESGGHCEMRRRRGGTEGGLYVEGERGKACWPDVFPTHPRSPLVPFSVTVQLPLSLVASLCIINHNPIIHPLSQFLRLSFHPN